MKGVKRLWEKAVGLVFPDSCAFCGEPTDESCVCGRCKLPLMRRKDMQAALHRLPEAAGYASPLFYAGGARKAILDMKEHGKRRNAAVLGRMLGESCKKADFGAVDFVTWIPQSRRSKNERGFNQSKDLACTVAKILSLPARDTLRCLRRKTGQKELSAAQRAANIVGSFAVRADAPIDGARFLLIDDVLTTGATMREAVKTLRAAGAAAVYAACAATTSLHADGEKDNKEDGRETEGEDDT